MKNDIYIIGEIGSEVTLKTVIDMVEASDQAEPLNVFIHSGGGGVYDGLAIYNYLKALPQQVNTKSSGLVASIASIIFLAGNKETRSINSTDNFLIHLPMGFAGGNATDLEKTSKELRDIENKLSDIYVNETDLTKEEALDLMNKDEMLNVDFLKEKGFVNTIVKFQAVANLIKNVNMSEQLTKADAESLFEKFGNKLKDFFNPKENAPVNKIVQDANGTEIDFPDVADDLDPVVGDKAQVDGKPADGEYVMPNGQKYAFAGGTLETIEEAEEETEEETPSETEALQAEIDALKEQLAASNTLAEEKEVATAGLTEKLEAIKTEFSELKNTITSNFDFENKTEQPKEKEEVKSRSNFKSKYR